MVAHFHFVLSLGSYSRVVIFLLWLWPVLRGCLVNKYLVQAQWIASMVGFNLCFFPMHFMGLAGLPRRVCSFDPSFYWLNMISRLGSIISAVTAFFLLFILFESLVVRRSAVFFWSDPLFKLFFKWCEIGLSVNFSRCLIYKKNCF